MFLKYKLKDAISPPLLCPLFLLLPTDAGAENLDFSYVELQFCLEKTVL